MKRIWCERQSDANRMQQALRDAGADVRILDPGSLVFYAKVEHDQLTEMARRLSVKRWHASDQATIGLSPATSITIAEPVQYGGTLQVFVSGRLIELEVAPGETEEQVARRLAEAINTMEVAK